MSTISFPLQPVEIRARNHAILCTTGFLILLPIGVLVARYTRTFTNKWFFPHAAIQLIISGPVIFAGWSMGYMTTSQLQQPHFQDPHQKMGLVLLILYILQVFLGAFIHYVKVPSLFRGHRPPQNYLHAFLGLVIFIVAASQVHYGLYTEWAFATGGLHQVPMSAKHAWLAFVVIFWVLYGLGLALLPRQHKQERKERDSKRDTQMSLHEYGEVNGRGREPGSRTV